MTDSPYTEGYRAGIAYEQNRLCELLDKYIMENPKPIQETLRRRFAFVRGLINDKESGQNIKKENK
jgi:hypothetical protein